MNHNIFTKFGSYIKAQEGLRQSPAGYMSWHQYLNSIGLSALQEHKDFGCLSTESQLVLNTLCSVDPPPRYITKEMSIAWQKTKVPKLNWNNPFVMPAYVLFPPCPLKEKPPEHFSDAFYIAAIMVIHRHDGLHVFAIDVKFDADDNLFRHHYTTMLIEPENNYNCADSDPQVYVIAMLAINSWLVHAHEPELIEQEAVPVQGGFGTKANKRSPIAPTWIGRNFKIRRESAPTAGQETGIKVRPHWRSGHWHTVRHGKGREQERLQWYRPVYVNSDTSS
ncbi:hypothetical protein EBT31_13125 [bacterium]|nr:hypothetical protein [bacterium]